MARIGAQVSATSQVVPTLENFKRAKHATYSVGTTAIPIPTTNLSYRRGIFIQNNHASNGLYVGSCDPQFIFGLGCNYQSLKHSGLVDPIRGIYMCYDTRINVGDTNKVYWVKSATGNEWYASGDAAGVSTAGLTQPTILYYSTAGGGDETQATSGSVGTLGGANYFGWGANALDPCNGVYSTLYVRTGGATSAYSPQAVYDYLMLYPLNLTADTTTTTGGLQVDAGATLFLTADGCVRLFGVASGASTPVAVFEVA